MNMNMNLDLENMTIEGLREIMARVQSLEEENNQLRSEFIGPSTPLPQQAPQVVVQPQVPHVVVQPNVGAMASKPPKYDGSRKMVALNIFISKMKNFILSQSGLDAQRQLAIASSYLEGSAYVWFLGWNADYPYGSFEQFLEALKSQFAPLNSEQDVRDRLRRLKQMTSVEKYSELYRKILEEAPEIGGEEKKSFFIQGLKEKIQLEVRVRNMGNELSFNEIERLALELDHIIFSQPRRAGTNSFNGTGRSPMEGVQFGLLNPEEEG